MSYFLIETSRINKVRSTEGKPFFTPEQQRMHTLLLLIQHLHNLEQRSPEVDIVDIPLPETDGSVSSSGQHVTFWALGKRWELEAQDNLR